MYDGMTEYIHVGTSWDKLLMQSTNISRPYIHLYEICLKYSHAFYCGSSGEKAYKLSLRKKNSSFSRARTHVHSTCAESVKTIV